MTYSVLPMWQPWASLTVNINPETGKAWKQVETRSRPTNKRGTILIHACLSPKAYKEVLLDFSPINVAFNEIEIVKGKYKKVPFGAIIGAVDIVDCGKIEVAFGNAIVRLTPPNMLDTEYKPAALFIETMELAFGDYQTGRYGWALKNPILFKNPIPYKGSQGWGKFETDKPLTEL